MILIVSENEDHSTSEVIQWLIYHKAKFVRVNKGDRLTLHKVQISNHKDRKFVLLTMERGEVDLDNVSAIWYRRGGLHFHLPNLDFIENKDLKQQAIYSAGRSLQTSATYRPDFVRNNYKKQGRS